jgi:protein-S-isoprenylcysteine O-methyltransferase Ste14
MLISIPVSALAIGSWLALFPSAMFCLVILKRTRIEDTLLQSNLPGYRKYMRMVPGRLFPRRRSRAFFHEDLDDRGSILREVRDMRP